MPTKLRKTIRREIEIEGAFYTVAISPDGMRLTRKRFRSGLAVSWKSLLRQKSALADPSARAGSSPAA
jgi:hypothetical protein